MRVLRSRMTRTCWWVAITRSLTMRIKPKFSTLPRLPRRTHCALMVLCLGLWADENEVRTPPVPAIFNIVHVCPIKIIQSDSVSGVLCSVVHI